MSKPLVPIAISSEIDNAGNERIHAATYTQIGRAVYVPSIIRDILVVSGNNNIFTASFKNNPTFSNFDIETPISNPDFLSGGRTNTNFWISRANTTELYYSTRSGGPWQGPVIPPAHNSNHWIRVQAFDPVTNRLVVIGGRYLSHSVDEGMTWNTIQYFLGSAGSPDVLSLAYHSQLGKFFFQDGNATGAVYIYSFDGATVTAVLTSLPTNTPRGYMRILPTGEIVLSINNKVYVSTDGITFNNYVTPATFLFIAYHPTYKYIGYSTNNTFYVSNSLTSPSWSIRSPSLVSNANDMWYYGDTLLILSGQYILGSTDHMLTYPPVIYDQPNKLFATMTKL